MHISKILDISLFVNSGGYLTSYKNLHLCQMSTYFIAMMYIYDMKDSEEPSKYQGCQKGISLTYFIIRVANFDNSRAVSDQLRVH